MSNIRHGRLVLVLVVVFAALGALPALASAAQAPVSGAPSSAWQTNGVVWALAYANGKVYVGGDFTSVRPPDAPVGSGEVARRHLAIFDAATGELLPGDPDLDGIVWSLVASPDGRTVYAGGDFLSVGGVAVRRLAAFDSSTDALIAGWKAKASASVRSLEVANGRVYIGGQFLQMNNQPRTRLAAVDATTGALDTWAPSADTMVLAISAARDATKIYVGGRFGSINGAPQHAIAALDPVTGATLAFPAAAAVPPVSSSCQSSVKDLTTDAGAVYAAAEGNGGGCFDGTFAANVADGSLRWVNTCLGATQSVEVVGGYLFKGSHAHDCSSVPGGFPETGTGGKFHLLAENLSDGLLGPWYPSTNGAPLGPRVFATDGSQLFVGGDFTYVNSHPQQGFTRFAATPPDTTAPTRPPTPRVASVEPGSVRINLTATWDRDDNDLTYTLLRDTAPIKTWTMTSKPWSLPTIVEHDDGLTPGSTHVYKLLASDATNATRSLTSATVTVTGSAGTYPEDIQADFPTLYWRLGERSGTTAADASPNNLNGTYAGATTKGVPGAITGTDTAVSFDGSTARVNAATSLPGPQRFSLEAWIKTSTRNGGKIIGFGNSQTGTSSSYDRHLYMTDNGRLIFGVFAGTHPGQPQTITTPNSYNDNNWHHLIATMDPNGMALYVDGTLVGTNPTSLATVYKGFWRVGGDNLNGWPSRPSSSAFRGTIDEVAVYPYALTGAQVAHHYRLR